VGRSTPPPVRGGRNRSGQGGRGRRGASSTTPSVGKVDGRTAGRGEGRRSARGGGRDTSSPDTTAKPVAVDQTSQDNINESNIMSDQVSLGRYRGLLQFLDE
jgi:hypothetical protein